MSEHEAEPRKSSTQKRRAKKRALVWALVLLILIGGAFGVKPAYHWLKAKRAAQLTAQANFLFAKGKLNEAASKYRAALQLDPMGYVPLQAAAHFSSRTSRSESVDLWEQ